MGDMFLATLFVLTYRLLFHSDRQLSLVSLIFCVSCAFCVSRLTEALFKDVAAADHVAPEWLRALDGPSLFIASCARPLCLHSGLSENYRIVCGRLIDLVHVNASHPNPEADTD